MSQNIESRTNIQPAVIGVALPPTTLSASLSVPAESSAETVFTLYSAYSGMTSAETSGILDFRF